MPYIPKRRLDALKAQRDRLRDRAEAAEQEAKVQTAAASRLAQRELTREGTIAGAAAALAACVVFSLPRLRVDFAPAAAGFAVERATYAFATVFPMFAAEPPQEPLPYGRWGEALAEQFAGAAEAALDPAHVVWFPDRTWNGRTYVPATAPAEGGEWFGYVSYTREHEGAQAADFTATADFTEETGHLTPSLKLKRDAILRDFDEEIEELYRK